MKPRIPLGRKFLALATLAAAVGAADVAAGETVRWRAPDWNAASQEARRSRKLVFVYVRDPICPWCDFFEGKCAADPAFAAWNNELFVNVKADMATHEGIQFVQERNLMDAATPRFYILSGDGRVLANMNGTDRDIPFQALSILRGRERLPVPFDPARTFELAKRLKTLKEGAKKDQTAIYAAMEAMAWYWAGEIGNANAAFGRGWAAQLPNDWMREWYVMFWGGWARSNTPAAAAVADAAFRAGGNPSFARYGAILFARMKRHADAARLGDAYLGAYPQDAQFAQALATWKARP